MPKAKGTKKSQTMARALKPRALKPRAKRTPVNTLRTPPPVDSREVRLGRIRISTTNPRKAPDQASLSDLTESILAHGVLQPVLLRPMPVVGGADTGNYEIVAGERRYRAALAAQLETIPAVIRELSDVEAAEIQIVENLQRSDLLPLEEAAGLLALHKKHGLTADEIAARIHKGRGYVYARMKLTELPKEAKKALGAGEISASVALLLARLPAAIAKKALPLVSTEIWRDGARIKASVSFRDAQIELQNAFGRAVKKAPWDLGDETLHKKQACAGCSRRSGTDPELFEDLVPRSADVCTDLPCWEAKLAAWTARQLKTAAAKGSKALSAKEAEKIFRYGSNLLQDGYVDLAGNCYEASRGSGRNKKWKAALGGEVAPEEIVLAVDGEGQIHKLLKEKRARELAREAGQQWAAKEPRASAGYQPSPQDKKLKTAHKTRTVAVGSAMEALVAAAESKTDWPRAVWQALVLFTVRELWHDSKQRVLSRRGWTGHALSELQLKKLSDVEIRGLLVELLASRDPAGSSYSTKFGEALEHFTSAFGVSLKDHHSAAKKLAAEKKKKPAKKAPVRKAKKAAPKKGAADG